MLVCVLTIVYYIGLIAYHIADIVSDWSEYVVEIHQKTHFAGVANIHKEFDIVILLTCITGTITGLLIAALYVYYIWFHCHITCSYKSSYKQLQSIRYENEGLLTCDERGDEDNKSKPAVCKRYVRFELVVSFLRLLLKESVQAGLLFYFAIQNDSNLIHTEWPDILFAICSVLGNCKLFFCFSAKCLGLGSGGKCLRHDRFEKCICLFGCPMSFVCGAFTVFYLSKAQPSWLNISHQID